MGSHQPARSRAVGAPAPTGAEVEEKDEAPSSTAQSRARAAAADAGDETGVKYGIAADSAFALRPGAGGDDDPANDANAADAAALPVVRGWARRMPGGLSELKVRAAGVIQRSMRNAGLRMHMHKQAAAAVNIQTLFRGVRSRRTEHGASSPAAAGAMPAELISVASRRMLEKTGFAQWRQYTKKQLQRTRLARRAHIIGERKTSEGLVFFLKMSDQ